MRVRAAIVAFGTVGFAIAAGCGGSTSGGGDPACADAGTCPSGGTGGASVGGAGGAATGGIGGAATGGTGGGLGLPCQTACQKLQTANCPVPFNLAQCTEECETFYGEYPQCKVEFDVFASCAIVNASVGCEDGEATFIDAQDACPGEAGVLAQCVSGTGGAGGFGGVGGSAGAGGSGGAIQCGNAICTGWKLGGLIDAQPCCTPMGCGALWTPTLQTITGLPVGCYPLNQPGTLECSCPSITFTNPLDNQPATLPGCCSNGTCGVWADFTSAEGPHLGCAKQPSTPSKPCAPQFPPPCSDAGN